MQVSFKAGAKWVGDGDRLVDSPKEAVIFIASALRVQALQSHLAAKFGAAVEVHGVRV